MEKNIINTTVFKDVVKHSPKKILFANFPADGHFNPLTGLAMHLKNIGYDVRWYTSKTYAQKLKKLNIIHYPFKQAMEVMDNNFDEAYPERTKIKNQVKKLVFDMIHAFILRAPEYYADMMEIRKEFAFDMVVCDGAFTAIPFIKEKINVPVISIGVFPLTETSKDLAPMGLGLTPSNNFIGKMKQAALRFIADKILFSKATTTCMKMFGDHGIGTSGSNMFDILVHSSTLMLQSGTPGFEYKRSDLGKNIKFIGAILPYSQKSQREKWYDKKLEKYEKVILVTQGTVEKDASKLLGPTLQALKNTDHLVVVTTGGSGTESLKKKYNCDNFIIEDFIPFTDVMPYADVYITNGGYGGVMLSIQNKLPMIVAGVHEGKNEISARVGYFNLGINLRTETPVPSQIKDSVEKILSDETYTKNIKQLCKEFSKYNSNELCAAYVDELFNKQNGLKIRNAYHYINN